MAAPDPRAQQLTFCSWFLFHAVVHPFVPFRDHVMSRGAERLNTFNSTLLDNSMFKITGFLNVPHGE